MKNNLETIYLGGGCFWCTEASFLTVPGVTAATSGYAGGTKANPTYAEVCTGETGHAEVSEIKYDPEKINLEKILQVFFKMHDSTSLNRQGNDAGTQYRSVIFWTSPAQKKIIEEFIKKAQGEYTQPIVTEVKKIDKFFRAEEYHQRYFEKNPDEAYCRFVIAPKVKKVKKFLSSKS